MTIPRLYAGVEISLMQAIEISSIDDSRVDVFRNVRDADLRGRDDLFMAESELVIRRLLRTPQRLHSLLLSPERFTRLRAELGDLPDAIPVYIADLKLMHEIAAFHIHRGVLAAGFRLPVDLRSLDTVLERWRLPSDVRPTKPGAKETVRRSITILCAEGLTNVDNMGAIFRNAAAFGVDAIILDPTCCDPLYRKAIRVSMGYALSIPYAVSQDWLHDLMRLKQQWGITLVAAETNDGAIPLCYMPKPERVGIIFGSEGHGVSAATLAVCDAVCAIPMTKDVSSINVAVASAVFLYELNRGRKP